MRSSGDPGVRSHRDDGDAVVVQRADEVAVEPRQLRSHNCRERSVAQGDAEELAVVDTPADQIDTELPALQPADERRLPGRAAAHR